MTSVFNKMWKVISGGILCKIVDNCSGFRTQKRAAIISDYDKSRGDTSTVWVELSRTEEVVQKLYSFAKSVFDRVW